MSEQFKQDVASMKLSKVESLMSALQYLSSDLDVTGTPHERRLKDGLGGIIWAMESAVEETRAAIDDLRKGDA